MVRSMPRWAFLCLPGLYTHTPRYSLVSMSQTRRPSSSPGLAPVSSCRSISAATCLLTCFFVSFTISMSTGRARKEKHNAVVPLTGQLVWNAQQRWPILLRNGVMKRLAGRGMCSTLGEDGR